MEKSSTEDYTQLNQIIIEIMPLEKDSGERTRDYWCAVEVA